MVDRQTVVRARLWPSHPFDSGSQASNSISTEMDGWRRSGPFFAEMASTQRYMTGRFSIVVAQCRRLIASRPNRGDILHVRHVIRAYSGRATVDMEGSLQGLASTRKPGWPQYRVHDPSFSLDLDCREWPVTIV